MAKQRKTQLRAVIGIGNYKGGVGKTTTVASLSAALSKKGYKILAVDLDPQSNLTYSLSAEENCRSPSTYVATYRSAESVLYRKSSSWYTHSFIPRREKAGL